MRATEIAQHVFLCVATFLVRDDDATFCAQLCQTARHCFVIGKETIAVQLDPIAETALDVIQRKRSLCMPRDLHPLPRAQVSIDVPARLSNLLLYRLDRRIKIDIMLV